jgi:hypothetical protein
MLALAFSVIGATFNRVLPWVLVMAFRLISSLIGF